MHSISMKCLVLGIVLTLLLTGACSRPVSSPAQELESSLYDPLAKPGAEIKPTGIVKSYDLTVKEATVELASGVMTPAITYNGQTPGPTIRVTEGDTLRVTVKNELDQDTSIHWHGLHVPNLMDGVPGITQDPIRPGQAFIYEFMASHAGTFMYHPHVNSVKQIDRGLYGLLVIDPQTPEVPAYDKEFSMMIGAWMVGMPMAETGGMAMDYNYFTINGKAFPANDPWTVKQGDRVKVRIINISNLAHPFHMHGMDFKIIAKDGEPVPATNQQWMNTLSIDAGETYDIAFLADNPGNWVFHCHELHHTENDGVEPGGLIQLIKYEGYQGYQGGSETETAPPMPAHMH